ncbi:MAG: hypothetical protein KJ736_12200 [Candidatus Omnitrophica bacterium]|nr:hypothetical protein [Candidatus Omnitrophota bacterium]
MENIAVEVGQPVLAGEIIGMALRTEDQKVEEKEVLPTATERRASLAEGIRLNNLEISRAAAATEKFDLNSVINQDDVEKKQLEAELGRVQAEIQAQNTAPANVAEGTIRMGRELVGKKDTSSRLQAFVGANFNPGNAIPGLQYSFVAGNGVNLNIGLLLDSRYASTLNAANSILGTQDLLAASGTSAVMGWIFYADALAQTVNMLQEERINYDERGGIMKLSPKGVWELLIDVKTKKISDPMIVEREGEPNTFSDINSANVIKITPAELYKDIIRKTLGNIPVIGSLFGDASKDAFWTPRKFPAIYVPGKAQQLFMRRAYNNDNPNWIYVTARGLDLEKEIARATQELETLQAKNVSEDQNRIKELEAIIAEFKAQKAQHDADGTRAEEYVHGYRYDVKTGEKKEFFRSKMFVEEKGKLLLEEWLRTYRMFDKQPGEFYVVPSRQILEQSGLLADVMRGYDAQGRKIMAAEINPATGKIGKIYYETEGLPAVMQVKAFERNGQTIYVGRSKVDADVFPGASYGTNDITNQEIHPYIIFSRYTSDRNYWLRTKTSATDTAHILVFSQQLSADYIGDERALNRTLSARSEELMTSILSPVRSDINMAEGVNAKRAVANNAIRQHIADSNTDLMYLRAIEQIKDEKVRAELKDRALALTAVVEGEENAQAMISLKTEILAHIYNEDISVSTVYSKNRTEIYSGSLYALSTTRLAPITEDDKPVDPTIVRMLDPRRGTGEYVDVSLPEHMQVIKPGSQYVHAGEIGIVINKPTDKQPLAIAHLPNRSVFLYSEADINGLVARDADGQIDINVKWLVDGKETATIPFVIENIIESRSY